MIKYLTFFCGTIGAMLFIVASIIGGLQIDGYSFISQYISESYATGVPNVTHLRYMYIASGILLFLFGLTAPATFPKSSGFKIGFVLFAIFYGLGTVATGYFPCDYGCPADSEVSLAQFIHNTAGFLVYSLVPFCLIGLGASFRKFKKTRRLSKLSFICGILSLVFVVFLFGNPQGAYIGLFQRIIEASILIWTMYCSFQILKTVKE